jgi:hypothetical protein
MSRDLPSKEAIDAAWLARAGPLRDTKLGAIAVEMQQIRAMLRVAYAVDFPGELRRCAPMTRLGAETLALSERGQGASPVVPNPLTRTPTGKPSVPLSGLVTGDDPQ